MAAAKKSQAKQVSFEDRLGRLDELVDQLESGELDLEQGVTHYKEGVELLSSLQVQLNGAEQRVEELSAQLRETLQALDKDDSDTRED